MPIEEDEEDRWDDADEMALRMEASGAARRLCVRRRSLDEKSEFVNARGAGHAVQWLSERCGANQGRRNPSAHVSRKRWKRAKRARDEDQHRFRAASGLYKLAPVRDEETHLVPVGSRVLIRNRKQKARSKKSGGGSGGSGGTDDHDEEAAAGLLAADLKGSGIAFGVLKARGFSAAELKAAGLKDDNDGIECDDHHEGSSSWRRRQKMHAGDGVDGWGRVLRSIYSENSHPLHDDAWSTHDGIHYDLSHRQQSLDVYVISHVLDFWAAQGRDRMARFGGNEGARSSRGRIKDVVPGRFDNTKEAFRKKGSAARKREKNHKRAVNNPIMELLMK